MGIILQLYGSITGGASMFSAEYTLKFKIVDYKIEFDTVDRISMFIIKNIQVYF